jgi:hypothetical protein
MPTYLWILSLSTIVMLVAFAIYWFRRPLLSKMARIRQQIEPLANRRLEYQRFNWLDNAERLLGMGMKVIMTFFALALVVLIILDFCHTWGWCTEPATKWAKIWAGGIGSLAFGAWLRDGRKAEDEDDDKGQVQEEDRGRGGQRNQGRRPERRRGGRRGREENSS